MRYFNCRENEAKKDTRVIKNKNFFATETVILETHIIL